MGKGIVKLGEGQWAVKDGNLLAAKETNGRFKNTEFTVSRGTRASYVGRDGLIKESNLQDVNLVNNGDFSELGSEYITNGDFSDGETGWTKGGAASATQSVVNGALVMYAGSASDANNSLSRTNTPQGYNGKTYKLELTVSDMLVSSTGFIRLDSTYDASNIISFGTGTSTIYFTAYRDFTHIRFFAGSAEDGYTIDNVSVKEVDPNDYWTFSGDSFTFPDGAARIARTTNTTFIQQNVLTSGKLYKVEFDVLDKDDNNGTFIVRLGSNNVYDVSTYEGTRFSKYITSAGIDFRIYSSSDNGVIYVDNIVVSEVKTDTPRIDFTDNTDGHLLLEPQSTNLVTYSEDFSEWIDAGTTTVLSNITNPSGGLQSYLLSASSSSTNALRYDLSFSASTNYSYSLFFKAETSQEVRMQVYDGSSFFRLAINPLNNFEIVDQSSINSYLIEDFKNGWKRVSINITSSSSASNGYLQIYPDRTGNLNGVYIYGGQLEALSHSTSYIPTNGSTVTRDAETCTGAGSSADFNSEEGVLYAEIAALENDGTKRRITLNNGTSSLFVQMEYRVVTNQIQIVLYNGSSQGLYTETLTDIKQFNKIAYSYKENEFKLFVNGSQIGSTILTGTTFNANTLTELDFDNGNAADKFYGKVKAIRVYKEALSDTDLENLTS